MMMIAKTTVLLHPRDLMDLIKMIVTAREALTMVVLLDLLVCLSTDFVFFIDSFIIIDGSSDSRRFGGLGSEERKPYGQSYGGGGHSEEYMVPNHMVGLLIGKGGENLKKIERMSGVSKVQFSNGI